MSVRENSSRIREGTPEFRVYVDDNFHYMDEEQRWLQGSYATLEEALAVAKKIVEESVLGCFVHGMNAEAVYDQYKAFGLDPFIEGPTATDFSAWDHAMSFARAIAPSLNTPAERHTNARPLRCPECATENASAEWYCKRCGGDLHKGNSAL